MSTSVAQIREWFDHGLAVGATHMVVVCDTFDYTDYPVYVTPDEDVRGIVKRYQAAEMSKVMEVYDLSMSKDEQTKGGTRVWNWGSERTSASSGDYVGTKDGQPSLLE